jgi:hypothetical protein
VSADHTRVASGTSPKNTSGEAAKSHGTNRVLSPARPMHGHFPSAHALSSGIRRSSRAAVAA